MTPPSEPWRAVLFDLDGTLADTTDLILTCYRHTMERHRGSPLPDDLWLSTMGQPLRVQMQAFASSPEEHAGMVETYVRHQEAIHDRMVRPFPGVVELLSDLERAGVPLAVVTSKGRRMATRTLECCGLVDFFRHIVVGDEVIHGKPHPEPVNRALEALGVEPGPDVLFVGDSSWDVLSGKAAGVGTAAALWGPIDRAILEEAGPDYLLAAPSEVLTSRAPG
ncbi:MAG: pyrophosphatase PpaX [Gemmatimonadota bacterium]|nr:MAG: pyrophosphatase PpaX [Gemmatimonadota bacterium]